MIRFALLAVLLLVQDDDKHRTGSYCRSFSERHALSGLKEVAKRQGWDPAQVKKADPGIEKFKLEDESFEIVVPDGYKAETPHGIFVWISPSNSGRIDAAWKPVLAKRNLIAIGADTSGNDRGVYFRVSLTLDAVHNLSKLYNVDPRRVYVSGFSGGGRSASRVGMAFADVFTGGIYQGGVDFWKNVPDPANPKKHFPATFARPEGELLKKAKSSSRHVILNGETDQNYTASHAIFDTMKKDEKFAHVTMLEMPKKDHVPADAEFLEKAIEALDAPLKDEKPGK